MKLATASILTQPDLARSFLSPWIRRVRPGYVPVGSVRIFPLHSVQAGRGVVRLLVYAGRRPPLELFANYDVHGGSRTIYRFLRHLHRHGFANGSYRAPTPLGYSPKYKLLVYQAFPGRRVRDELERCRLSARRLAAILGQSAGWLRKFHSLPATVGRHRPAGFALVHSSRLPASLRRQLSPVVREINAALRAAGRRDRATLVHGDPHLANCIHGQHGFAFIDYSESYVGHPLADVAMFLVHLDLALHPYFTPRVVVQLQRRFLGAYFGRSVERLPTTAQRTLVAYHMRSALEFLVFSSNTHHRPRGYMAWIIKRLTTIVETGSMQLSSPHPIPPLAA